MDRVVTGSRPQDHSGGKPWAPCGALTWVAACAFLAACVAGAQWPQWRGPGRDGVVPDSSGWPAGWPPKRLWARNVGHGCTSPIVADGAVYVMGWQGGSRRSNPVGQDTVFRLDAMSGAVVWQQSYPARYQGRHRAGDIDQYGGPSSTPALDGDIGRLYTLGVDGELRCWQADDAGRVVWSANLYDTHRVRRRPNVGGGQRDFGMTSSPLLYRDSVIVEVGAEEGTVMAFDKASGEHLWASQETGPAGHTGGPVLTEIDGVPCLVVLTLSKLVIMRLDAGHEGATLAEYPWATDFGCNIPTPAVEGDRIVLSSGYNRRRTCLLKARNGKVESIWDSRTFAVVGSPVVHREHVFLVCGQLHCLDLATGELRWRGGRFVNGSCAATAGDGKLVVFGGGRLALVEAEPERREYTELAGIDGVVPATCYPHVAVADGLIVCKDRDGNMVCFSTRGTGGS